MAEESGNKGNSGQHKGKNQHKVSSQHKESSHHKGSWQHKNGQHKGDWHGSERSSDKLIRNKSDQRRKRQ